MRVNSTDHKKYHFKLLILLALFSPFFIVKVHAQFTFKDDFKKNTAPDVIIGGSGGINGTAYLTSGIDDPLGAGWLRLTNATTNQGGYAYVNKSFPSTLGVVMDFEYKMWRNVPDSFDGADGIGVFLFDAADVETNGFRLGAYGGALGYTSNTDEGITYGLRGGYIGIGFDALGNYANTIFGPKNGGVGIRPNAVSLRGPTNDTDLTQSNVFLTGVTILNGHNIVPITTQGNWTDNELDYNTTVSSRPDDNTFYRRIQIEMQPVMGGYRITVRWKTALNSDFVQLVDYTTTLPPPELLSVGFAASTGAGVNLHEVRNLTLTTPGNLRITKQTDKSYLQAITGSGLNQITYYIDVVNDTPAALQNIDFADVLTDVNGNQIAPSMFAITGISHTGFLSGTNLPVTSAVNQFSGTLNMAANSTGRIIITGELAANQIPTGNILNNRAEVSPTDITDEDLGNNIAEVAVPVLAENVDIVAIEESNNFCVTGTNQFKLRVANIGTTPATYRRIGTAGQRIAVTKTVPSTYTYDDSATPGGFDNSGVSTTARWSKFITPDSPSAGQTTYTYVARSPIDDNDHTLAGLGTVYEPDYPITYSITPAVGTISYVNAATVSYTDVCATDPANCYTGANLEPLTPSDNTANNTISETINTAPIAPAATATIQYCQNASAVSLTATADPGNTLLWYTTLNGSSSTIAPVPLTNQSGIFTYYVSQENGLCEGPKTTITVTILDLPTSGSIAASQTVCNGQLPAFINSASAGTGTNISYRWESSLDGISWTTIAGATDSFYQPPAQTVTHQYRRISLSNYPGGPVCESVPTNVSVVTTKRCEVVSNPMVRQRVK